MFQITGGSGLKVSELLETTFGEPKIYRMRVQDDEHFGFLRASGHSYNQSGVGRNSGLKNTMLIPTNVVEC